MKNDPRFVCGIGGCQKHHHKTLHSSTTPFVAKINATKFGNADDILLLVQTIPTMSGAINCFWDNGSTCCLITRSAAHRLNLFGEPMSITIKTVSGLQTLDSQAYQVSLVDTYGKHHIITAFCVDNISSHLKSVDISNVKGEFSGEMQSKWDMLDRPTGEIELLVGLNAFSLHPRELEVNSNLKVMVSSFGTGYLLGGAHSKINLPSIEWNETVSSIRLASSQKSVSYASHTVNTVSIFVKPLHEFFEGDVMGIEPPRRCGNCLKCKECSFRGYQLSQQEQYEYHIIESKINYVESQQCFHVQYPFTDDPHSLSSNRAQVTKMAERLEKKLMKEVNLSHFNKELDKMISHRAIVELTKEDMESWCGAVHYVSFQHVIKEDSPTTPLRIVTNSSLSDRRGISLNNILMKGPNTLSNQWEILNRWRMYETAMCSDVSKAYWSLRTGEVEKHIRRIVWRYGDSTLPWKIFGFCVVSFGDRPAAAILEVAIKKIAELYKSVDPEAAHKITTDRYVDDIASGGTPEQVSRFVGEETGGKYDGTVPEILSRGALNLKVIVTSGETSKEKLEKLGNTVLGIGWDAPSDTICINFMNSLKHPIATLIEGPLSLRLCLSIVNSIYDPLGLVTPITVRLKVAFRDLFRHGLNLAWDDPIPREDHEHWSKLVLMLVTSRSISFPRATKPQNAVGKCQLICFFDGSDLAYASVIYIRWNLDDGSVFTTLVTSKARTTPLQRISTPRSELNGATVASRLLISTLRSWSSSEEPPEKVWVIGDSELRSQV